MERYDPHEHFPVLVEHFGMTYTTTLSHRDLIVQSTDRSTMTYDRGVCVGAAVLYAASFLQNPQNPLQVFGAYVEQQPRLILQIQQNASSALNTLKEKVENVARWVKQLQTETDKTRFKEVESSINATLEFVTNFEAFRNGMVYRQALEALVPSNRFKAVTPNDMSTYEREYPYRPNLPVFLAFNDGIHVVGLPKHVIVVTVERDRFRLFDVNFGEVETSSRVSMLGFLERYIETIAEPNYCIKDGQYLKSTVVQYLVA